MAGFDCVSPACFPVIEMAGFDPLPPRSQRSKWPVFAGVKKGAGWRSGEGTMISAIMRKRIAALFYWSSARFAKRVIKDVITRKRSGRGRT
jgi:hypothetical protein